MDSVAKHRTDVKKSPTDNQAQAAESSDLRADFVAVLVVPVLAEEPADFFDEEEPEDGPPDSLEGTGTLGEPESPRELLLESLRETLPEPWRELLRESVL